MSMIFTLPAAVWTIYWLVKENKLAKIGKVVAGVFLGVGAAAFFILPVVFERQYAHTETLTMGYFGYLQHFVNVFKLFISGEWGYGSSGFPNEKLNLSTGLIQWIFALVSLVISAFYIFVEKKNKVRKNWSLLVVVLSLLELFILFMIHVKSSFIWKLIPLLAWLQFPWRFLTVSVFLLAVIGGIGVYLLPKLKKAVGFLLIFLAVILNISYFVPKDWIDISDAEKFSGASWQKQLTISIFDYLPVYAKLPPISAAPAIPEVLQGNAVFISYVKGSDFQKGKVMVLERALVRLPLFDFPGMRVRIDGNPVSHINNDCSGQEFCLGLITFNIPAGEHEIEVELEDTPVRRVGNYLSLGSLAGIGWILIKKNKNEKDF